MKMLWPLLLLLGGCSGQPAIAPGGIVSNNPCIDGVLAQIAAPDQIAAVSVYSHDPDGGSAPLEWTRARPAIGMSAEEVIAAKPRMLLTGNLASSGTNAALARAGVKLKTFGVPATVDENIAQVRDIAQAIDRTAQGDVLVTQIIAAAAQKPSRGQSAIIWQSGGFVAGKGTLQDELLSRAGYRNASSAYGLKQWEQLPLETLIRNPPDVIFMPFAGNGDAARELAVRQKLLRHLGGRTQAVGFPDKLLFCGGPTILEVMRVLGGAKNPASEKVKYPVAMSLSKGVSNDTIRMNYKRPSTGSGLRFPLRQSERDL
jgi:iron complex transport system substrate-binding protein